MGATTLSNVRLLLCIKPGSEWEKIGNNQNKILMKGEIGINADTGQFKIGTGIVDTENPSNSGTWNNLPYVNMGSNYEEKITNIVKNLITTPKENETKEIYNILVDLIKANSVTDFSSIDIAEGTQNGSIKWRTSTEDEYKETKITGLGTAAFQNIGTEKKNIPAIGTAISEKENYPLLADNEGKIKPGTAALGSMAYADTTDYLNKTQLGDEILNKMKANDSMVFKGTIGGLTEIPTLGVKVGDTYKITKQIKNTDWGPLLEVGDMLIALKDAPEEGLTISADSWAYVPSGNESTVSTDILVDGSNTLILDGNFS